MADIWLVREHQLDKADLRARINGLLVELGRELGVSGRWEGDICTLKGTGIEKGEIRLGEGKVELDVTLQMMARMFKGVVEDKLVKRVDAILSA